MALHRFTDRSDAGRRLADVLVRYAGQPGLIVLGLPRGGVPVAAEVARRLGAPLDLFLVRKLGVPGHAELAMGAIAEGNVQVLDELLIAQLGIGRTEIDRVSATELQELERRARSYRGVRRRPDLSGRVVIVVDDGLATGATMQAAAVALQKLHPAKVILAAPVGAADTCARLRQFADEVVCAEAVHDLGAVGLWYDDFTQTTDDEVRRLIAAAGEMARERTHSTRSPVSPVVELLRRRAHPIDRGTRDYDDFIADVRQARLVLMGEASHGTHEFYRERAELTRRLISEEGFAGVAVEADWPDAHRVNRYVRAVSDDQSAVEALGDFERFPAWMWRNTDVVNFIDWLRAYNEPLGAPQRAGFYGLDLYGLHASMRAVVAFLDKVDPEAAARARTRYACFDRFGDQMQAYAHSAALGLEPSCERDVVAQLVELRRQAARYAQRDGSLASDELFVAEQNARVVRDAEAYYRSMLGGRVESWNLRDRHMTDTLVHLLEFLDRPNRPARVVVWAHNSHLGDARATEMGDGGEVNVGQLVRERLDSPIVSLGFTTHTGTVTAAAEWGGAAQRRHVRPSLEGSIERLLHETGLAHFLFAPSWDADLARAFAVPLLERAIGVIYRPESERRSHYFRARLSGQFDYVMHLDRTRAVEPLERTAGWEAGELPETYPSGL